MQTTTSLRFKSLLISCFFIFLLFSHSVNAEDGADETKNTAPVYIELTPDFIVNYAAGSARLKYIKTKISLRTDSTQANIIEDNMPLVRDALVLFLSSRDTEQVTGAVAREKTREEAAQAINDALKKETGQEPVKDVLFSSFVTQ